MEVVGFLNFKAKRHSGRALKESDVWKPGMEHFRELSPPLRQRIKKEIFVRPLRAIYIKNDEFYTKSDRCYTKQR